MLPASGVEGSRDQVTAVLVVLVTAAVNGCVCPALTVASFGLTVTTIGSGTSGTWAMAHAPDGQQARIVSVVLLLTDAGAVYVTLRPACALNVPREALHEGISWLVQGSAVDVRQRASNRCVPLAVSWTVGGATLMVAGSRLIMGRETRYGVSLG